MRRNGCWRHEKILIFILVVGVISAVGYNHSNGFQADDDSREPLPLIEAAKGTIERQAIAVGHILPAHSVDVKSQVEGIVGDIYFQEGDQIKAGDKLIKVTPNPTPQDLSDAITAVT